MRIAPWNVNLQLQKGIEAQHKAGADGDAGRNEQRVDHPDGAGQVISLHKIPDAHGKGDAGSQDHQSTDDGVTGFSAQQTAAQNTA